MNNGQPTSVSDARAGEPLHGGYPGWFRVANACCVLATLQMTAAAWVTIRKTDDTGPNWLVLGVVMSIAAACLLVATILANRQRARAGLYIVIAYALHAIASLIILDVPAPPSLWMIFALLTLFAARASRDASK